MEAAIDDLFEQIEHADLADPEQLRGLLRASLACLQGHARALALLDRHLSAQEAGVDSLAGRVLGLARAQERLASHGEALAEYVRSSNGSALLRAAHQGEGEPTVH